MKPNTSPTLGYRGKLSIKKFNDAAARTKMRRHGVGLYSAYLFLVRGFTLRVAADKVGCAHTTTHEAAGRIVAALKK